MDVIDYDDLKLRVRSLSSNYEHVQLVKYCLEFVPKLK